ncbi:MAG: AmmeMemoRadiSam system radical SAM enzyme [Spirochaetia bacterium]|jgi:pyruvate formate lyase activating enzyme
MMGEQARREALWCERRPDGRIACLLCPHACVIADGGHGICGVRFNRAGSMEIPLYGRISSFSVDPIEKKPLYHFHPGSRILSVGFVGCSFHCKFCQNWHISQGTNAETRYMGPGELVEAARRENSFGIAYTYSEPLVHAEYLMDTMRLAREAGLKNVLVSNGYISPGPADELLGLVDAANIDLKAFDPDFYRTETGGKLEEVKRFISQAAGLIHLEITTLVIPTKNDTIDQVEGIARFVASLDPGIPFHLSAYHPQYRYEIAATPGATLRKLAEAAKRHLQFVYMGNIGPEETTTPCLKCGSTLVRRVGYSVRVEGITAGACAACGAPAPIVMGD